MLNAELNTERLPMLERGDGRDLKHRTKAFAVRIIRLCATLTERGVAEVIGRQLLRSGTSVGAQYREALRARSAAEFVSKIESASQELEESLYWMELLVEADVMAATRMTDLTNEANELLAMMIASCRTAKMNRNQKGV